MGNALLLLTLGIAVFSGVALLIALFVDQRREALLKRIAAITDDNRQKTAEAYADPLARRPESNLASRRALRRLLDAALAGTGNRLRLPHLVAAALLGMGPVAALTLHVIQLSAPLSAICILAAGLIALIAVLRHARAKYEAAFLDVFPDAVDLIVRAIRAGLPVTEAIDAASHEVGEPVRGQLRRAMDELRIGGELETVLLQAADRIKLADFRFFVVSLVLQRQTGGNLAETLANLSQIIRRRKEARLKARSATSESRTTIWVLTVLPFVMLGVLSLINPRQTMMLIDDPRGQFMSGLAIASLATGLVVMRLIVRRTLKNA